MASIADNSAGSVTLPRMLRKRAAPLRGSARGVLALDDRVRAFSDSEGRRPMTGADRRTNPLRGRGAVS
jgi:hypothetical protein